MHRLHGYHFNIEVYEKKNSKMQSCKYSYSLYERWWISVGGKIKISALVLPIQKREKKKSTLVHR